MPKDRDMDKKKTGKSRERDGAVIDLRVDLRVDFHVDFRVDLDMKNGRKKARPRPGFLVR